jgi:hypothetical protein
VKGGAAGDHVPHEVGALLLEGSDDDCSHMFLLHWTLDNTEENNRLKFPPDLFTIENLFRTFLYYLSAFVTAFSCSRSNCSRSSSAVQVSVDSGLL